MIAVITTMGSDKHCQCLHLRNLRRQKRALYDRKKHGLGGGYA